MPALQGILTLEPNSSPGTAPTAFLSSWIEASARETSYELCLRYFVGSYFSLLLACPCGGRRVIVSDISEREVIVAILAHLGLPTEAPPVARARSPAFELS